jgi:hypothetical protein
MYNILYTIWPGADLTGNDLTWGRFDLGPIWLGTIWLGTIWLGADLTGKNLTWGRFDLLSFNFTFRYIDNVFSVNNSIFGDFVDHIYPIELEIKDTTDTDRSASHLDLYLEIDSGGRLRTKLCDKRDDFNFPIVNFPLICSNFPAAPAHGVYISQLIRYSRACGSYQDFLDRWLLLTRKLLNQGFLLVRLKSSLRKFYDRHHDLVDRYGISESQMTTDMFHL